jgi:hypothetical protein
MSTPSGPPRGYSFPPLFRGTSSSQTMRVSDAERQAVVDRLAAHFADGRLDHAEFDERVGQAMNAKTHADLSGLFADLPESAPQAAPPVPRRRRPHPVLGLVLLVVVILAAAHAVFAGPWLWFGFLAVAVLFATRRFRHYRPAQDH